MQHFTTLIAIILVAVTSYAQQPGINPKNLSDCRTAQLKGNVAILNETITAIDYSRHTIVYGNITAISKTYYNEDGNITKKELYDGNGTLIQKTIYQYEDGLKIAATTYDASDTRTLQTLYANTADGFCARLRCTDAIGVTISTSEISIKENWTKQTEEFQDGEIVDTEWLYNNKGELIKKISNGQETDYISTITLNNKGFPIKNIVKTNNSRTIFEFVYDKISPEGNWLERTVYKDGIPIEKHERTISLH
jgi:hypothetical protein